MTTSLFKKMMSVMLVGSMFAFYACDSESDPAPIVATTITNINADYGPFESPLPTNRPPRRLNVTNKFTLFSFKTGAIVPNADSATNKWDIGFRSTTIIFNSGTSGPGTSTAQLLSGTLDGLLEAPLEGYKSDNKNGATAAERNVLPVTSGAGWYTYVPASNLVSPIAGKVIVVKTSEGRYAKVEILSYYQNAPVNPSPEPTGTDKDRYYTFRYVYQPNDTRSFQ